MKVLGTLDYGIIVFYLAAVLAVGFMLARRASSSLEDYFLGGRNLPWYLLGTSGMAQWFDITGTMLICSFLFMMGPRGLFVEFRGGAVLVLAFLLCFTGKWHRRSGCMTGAEWNIFRFGRLPNAEAARLLTVVPILMITVGMIGYLVRGVGLFLSTFFPYPPSVCSMALLIIATIYTVFSGFYGVVITDVLQSLVIMVCAAFISVKAWLLVNANPQVVGELARSVTGNAQWLESMPVWRTTMPAGYEAYECLIMVAFFYFLRNALAGFATIGDQKYFAARDERSCGLLSMLVAWLIMLRWPMMMGLAVMGIFMVSGVFADPEIARQAASALHAFDPSVTQAAWHELTARIALNPSLYPPELIGNLRELLGEDWGRKLALVGFHGTIDPERILPAVILNDIPAVLRGMMLVAMIAASMSTFDSTLNLAASMFVRDFYQRWLRPRARNRELIGVSYTITVVLVLGGFFMGCAAKNINDIWGWLIMSLTAGTLMPAMLRLYWWRFNGWGVAAGAFSGGVFAVLQRIYLPDLPEWQQFVGISAITLVISVVVALLTAPTPPDVLRNFYMRTRPFGWWGPVKRGIDPETRASMHREHVNDVAALPFALVFQVTLFLLPMQVVIHTWNAFAVTLAIFLISCVGMYIFWWRNLPPPGLVHGETTTESLESN